MAAAERRSWPRPVCGERSEDRDSPSSLMRLVVTKDPPAKQQIASLLAWSRSPIPKHLKRVSPLDGRVALCPVDAEQYQHGEDPGVPVEVVDAPAVSPASKSQAERWNASGSFWPCVPHLSSAPEWQRAPVPLTLVEVAQCEGWMREAVAQAGRGGRAVGVVVVDPQSGKVVGRGKDETERSPLRHAVMVAIEDVARGNSVGYLCSGCDLYVTREPCVMCAMAATHSRFARVFWGAPNPETGGLGSRFSVHLQPQLNHHLIVWRDLLSEECCALTGTAPAPSVAPPLVSAAPSIPSLTADVAGKPRLLWSPSNVDGLASTLRPPICGRNLANVGTIPRGVEGSRLSAEETLFLVDTLKCAVVTEDAPDVPCEPSAVWTMCLGSGMSWARYLAYASLKRLGYIVLHHPGIRRKRFKDSPSQTSSSLPPPPHRQWWPATAIPKPSGESCPTLVCDPTPVASAECPHFDVWQANTDSDEPISFTVLVCDFDEPVPDPSSVSQLACSVRPASLKIAVVDSSGSVVFFSADPDL